MYISIEEYLHTIPGGIQTGDGETAFPPSMAQKIMEIALANRWIILGGDILTGQLDYAYANWHYEPDENCSLIQNVKGSIHKCEQYISGFAERNGNDFLVVYVMSNASVSGK